MPLPQTTLQETFTQYLISLNLSGITWANPNVSAGSPYYMQAPEGDQGVGPTLPFVEYEFPEQSTLENFFEGGYEESYEPIKVRVLGLQTHIDTLISPYVNTSVIYALDQLMNGAGLGPSKLNGTNFKCNKWYRMGWGLTFQDPREPGGARVWIAEAQYSASVIFNLNG